MTRNVTMELSIREIAYLAKKRWKPLLVVAIICAVLAGACGVVSGLKADTEEPSKGEQALYNENLELYDSEAEKQDYVTTIMKKCLADTSKQVREDPLMKLDPNNCERIQILLRFEDGTGAHRWSVENWINKADDTLLFGDKNKNHLEQYKSAIIQVTSNSVFDAPTNELNVNIFKVKGFDADSAASYLMEYFKKQAKSNNIELVDVDSSQRTGYCAILNDYQKNASDRLNSYYNSNNNANYLSNVFAKPTPLEGGHVSLKKNILKYGFVGFILGLIIGLGIIIFRVYRKGCVLSDRQMMDSFGLDLLSNFSNGHKVSIDILDANLDMMTEKGSNIMIVGTNGSFRLVDLIKEWDKDSDRHYYTGVNIIDDPKTLDNLQEAKGVVLAVRFGESKLEDIQRTILKSNKLNRNVLGYILV